MLGALTLAVLSWLGSSLVLTGNLPWDADWKPDRLELTKFALTLLAGAAAIVALVVTYRKQKDVEDGRFVERFGAAAAKLGAATAAERLAGAYAMAGAADRHPKQAQQCIEVLCGYLRSPNNVSSGDDSNLIAKKVVLDKSNDLETTEKNYAYLANDEEVRRGIVRLIADHIHKDAYPGWHDLSFDFRGATLPIAPFRDSVFRGTINLEGGILLDTADFTNSRFEGWSSFRATFKAAAIFNSTTFIAAATFSEARFDGAARFENMHSTKASYFADSIFNGSVGFGNAAFSGSTNFQGVNFAQPPTCKGATVKNMVISPMGTVLTETDPVELDSVLSS